MKIADDIMYSLFKDEEPNNAIDLLKFDHRNVNTLFAQCLKEEEPAKRHAVLKEIIEELTLHAAAEEKYIYPILNVQDEGLSQEAYEEHHVMKVLLAEAAQLNGSEPNFKAKIKVLSEIVNHHVLEEEAQMLPKVQHSGFDMKELADKIKVEKEKLRSAGINLLAAPLKANQSQSAKPIVKAAKTAHREPPAKTKAKPVSSATAAAKAKTLKKSAQPKATASKKAKPIAKHASKKASANASAKSATKRGKAPTTSRAKTTTSRKRSAA